MDSRPLRRRPLLIAPVMLALGGASSAARAARRQVEDLGLALELPDNWVPIPRAEILEAVERARGAGAVGGWTLRSAWQRLPHQRWFSLPHLLLETQPAPGKPDVPPRATTEIGRAGTRSVHTHRAGWRRGGLRLRLTLLAFEDQQPLFDAALASLEPPPPR